MFQFKLGRIPVSVFFSYVLFSALIGFSFAQQPDGAANRWPSNVITQLDHPSRALTLGLLVVMWVAIITVSVLVHELGHAVVALRFGYKPQIQLVGMQGLTMAAGTEALPWWKAVLYSLGGPTAGLALGVGSGLALLTWRTLGTVPDAADYLLRNVFLANLFWTGLNLLPLATLDGGHITAAVLTRIFGRRGFLLAQLGSLLLVLRVLIYAAQTQQAFLAVLIAIQGFRSFANIMAYTRGELPLGAATHPLIAAVERAEAVAREKNFPEAERIAREVLAQEPPAVVTTRAHFLLGWVALKQGDGRRALDHFSQVQGTALTVPAHAVAAAYSLIGDEARALPLWAQAAHDTNDDTILHEFAGALLRSGREVEARSIPGVKLGLAYAAAERVLYVRGDYARAAQMAESAFHEAPSAGAAYDAACAFARAGNVTDAMRLLTLASQNGFAETSTAKNDPDLASLRDTPAFIEWLQSLPGPASSPKLTDA